MDGEVPVLPLDVLERVEVPARREPGLRAGDVEPDDPVVAVAHGELGDLERPGGVPHRGQQGADADAGLLRPLPEPFLHRLHDGGQRETALGVQLGGEAHLGVDHAVLGEVERALPRHPHERVGRLHHPDGVREGRQVRRQRAGVRGLPEPDAEVVRVARRQVAVAVLLGELDDGLRAQPAVQVVVQEHLRRAPDLLRYGPAHLSCPGWPSSRCTVSEPNAGRHTAT